MDIMKRVSILGDSVSTYTGWNPEGYAVFYENGVPARNGMNSYRDTWWARVLSEMGAELCVNDSYSGSKVSGKDFPAAAIEHIMSICCRCKPLMYDLYKQQDHIISEITSLQGSPEMESIILHLNEYKQELKRMDKYYDDIICTMRREMDSYNPAVYGPPALPKRLL